MDQETFEHKIRKKFEGQSRKAPAGSWDEVEHALNSELISTYESQNHFYKWVSFAAVLIAVLLLGVLLAPISDEVSSVSGNQSPDDNAYYNALLSSDYNIPNYSNQLFTGGISEDLTFETFSGKSILAEETESEIANKSNTHAKEVIFLAYLKSPTELAKTSNEIHRYHTLQSTASNSKGKDRARSAKPRLWAGVEAGAGTFESGIGEANLSNALNQNGLASAVGSVGFVNPTTDLSQDMGQAVSTNVAVDFGLQLGDRWTLESGLAYTSFENSGTAAISVLDVFTINNSDFFGSNGLDPGIIDGSSNPINQGANARETSIEIENNYDYNLDINNTVRFASVPVRAGYFLVNNKLSLRLNAGVSANYLVEGQLSDPSAEIVNGDALNLYNEWSFDGVGGLEFGYSLFDQFDVTIEPNYQHSITPISRLANTPSRFVLQTGLRYTIK